MIFTFLMKIWVVLQLESLLQCKSVGFIHLPDQIDIFLMLIFYFDILQDEKNQMMTTNVWLKQVSLLIFNCINKLYCGQSSTDIIHEPFRQSYSENKCNNYVLYIIKSPLNLKSNFSSTYVHQILQVYS